MTNFPNLKISIHKLNEILKENWIGADDPVKATAVIANARYTGHEYIVETKLLISTNEFVAMILLESKVDDINKEIVIPNDKTIITKVRICSKHAPLCIYE